MRRIHLAAAVLPLVIAAFLGCAPERVSTNTPTSGTPRSSQATSVVGQLLLPGEGSHGDHELRLDLRVWVAAPDGEERQLWLFPDADGRFVWDAPGELTRLSVYAGVEVHRVDASEFPPPDDDGRIDLGSIDLRAELVPWRVRVRATEGSPRGVVRTGRWIGPPHRGPLGELPSLGSKQFPPVELGGEVEWLLPPNATDVHFLVERPDGPGRGLEWRTGHQQVFGPFDASALPLQLVLD